MDLLVVICKIIYVMLNLVIMSCCGCWMNYLIVFRYIMVMVLWYMCVVCVMEGRLVRLSVGKSVGRW